MSQYQHAVPSSIVYRPSIKDHRQLTIDHRSLSTDHRPSSIVHRPSIHRPQTIVLFLALAWIISSCTTQKQLTYLQGIDEVGEENFFPYSRPEYRLQKQDVLYVNIVTLNQEVNRMLNPEGTSSTQQIGQMQGGGAYLMGYTIRDSGYISLPVIGNVIVIDKTMEEATTEIEIKVSEMLKDATVVVKLMSYKITILGEVSAPGNFAHYGNQLTILDALGLAGNITDYGDRSNVLVIRPTNEGSNVFRVDLQDKNILLSDAYFLLPNDIVIVEPLNAKLIKLNAPTISFFVTTVFSILSATLLIYSVIK